MFFTHSNKLTENEKRVAKSERIELVQTLIKHYKALETLYQKGQHNDLANFLNQFTIELKNVNHCTNKTETISDMLKEKRQTLTTHPEYKKINDILANCLVAINKENGYAQDRVRNLARNDLAKIKNRSIYTSSIPIAAIISGAILAVFNLPVGLIVLGITVITGILSQAIYWSSCHKEYAQLHTKIKQDVLTSDYVYASGEAIPLHELPSAPVCALKNNNDLGKEHARPFLFGKEVDPIVDEFVEAVPELLIRGATAVCAGLFEFCSNISQAVSESPGTSIQAPKRDLHTL